MIALEMAKHPIIVRISLAVNDLSPIHAAILRDIQRSPNNEAIFMMLFWFSF
jgi:hypothetical protein